MCLRASRLTKSASSRRSTVASRDPDRGRHHHHVVCAPTSFAHCRISYVGAKFRRLGGLVEGVSAARVPINCQFKFSQSRLAALIILGFL